MSREARYLVTRLLELDPKRRFKASDLIKEQWIKCHDLPLSIFETAGGLFRANSMDNRAALTLNFGSSEGTKGRSDSKAETFNKSLTQLHLHAIDHLKGLGYSSKAIDESMKPVHQGNSFAPGNANHVYKAY